MQTKYEQLYLLIYWHISEGDRISKWRIQESISFVGQGWAIELINVSIFNKESRKH